MGNCLSISPHNKNSDSKLAAQIGSPPSQENTDKSQQQTAGENWFLPPQSPMRHVAGFQGFNSKDEVFFDSQPWLDSDCEDYFSINGDTPSRGNTPIHPQSFSQETPVHPKSFDQATAQIDEVYNTENTLDSETKSPPMDMKKQLIELFRESVSKADADGDQNSQHQQKGISSDFNNIPPESASRSPNTIRSSETTPYGDYCYRKEKSAQNAQGCIPSLRRSLSFSDRRKRTSFAKTGGW